jgi:hypothetical protein
MLHFFPKSPIAKRSSLGATSGPPLPNTQPALPNIHYICALSAARGKDTHTPVTGASGPRVRQGTRIRPFFPAGGTRQICAGGEGEVRLTFWRRSGRVLAGFESLPCLEGWLLFAQAASGEVWVADRSHTQSHTHTFWPFGNFTWLATRASDACVSHYCFWRGGGWGAKNNYAYQGGLVSWCVLLR